MLFSGLLVYRQYTVQAQSSVSGNPWSPRTAILAPVALLCYADTYLKFSLLRLEVEGTGVVLAASGPAVLHFTSLHTKAHYCQLPGSTN